MMRYEIEPETFAIRIFNDVETVPFQYQPDYPNGDPFDSEAEATAWAEASIAAHDSAVLVNAPIGKGLAGESKISPLMATKASAIAGLVAGRPLTPAEAATLVL